MFISILTTLLGQRVAVALAPVLPYILGAIILVGGYFYIRYDAYNDGVDDTTARYEQLIQEESDRIKAANDAALAQAEVNIEKLQNRVREQSAEINKLEQEAASDPNANRPALGADSVSRIDGIR